MHGGFLCLVCVIWHDMNLFYPSCRHDSFKRDLWFLYFLFVRGTLHCNFCFSARIWRYQGKTVHGCGGRRFACEKKLLALQNLNTVIHTHHYFNKYPVTLIQALHVYGKYVSSNWRRLHYHCLLCRKPFFSAFSVAFFSSPYNPDVNWEFVYPQFTAVY